MIKMGLKDGKFIWLFGAIIITVLGFSLIYKERAKPPEIVKNNLPAKAMVALVVDDLGYNLRDIEELFELDYPITLGILPKLRYSSSIARMANEKGFEVILHLPLEPHSGLARPGPGAIYTTMKKAQVKKILREDLDSVPYAKGISNHMGSKATEDEVLMGVIFSEIKESDLYFLDSLVTPKSLGSELSHRLGIRFTQRDVFLDNEDDPDYIRAQIRKLAWVALRKGKAVGTCHQKATTLAVLKEMLPQLEEEGIKFIYVSELAK